MKSDSQESRSDGTESRSDDIESGRSSKQRFYQIDASTLKSIDSKFKVLKILDVTVNIKFDLSLGEKKILEFVNACVSHEMRNPINAILGMNSKL